MNYIMKTTEICIVYYIFHKMKAAAFVQRLFHENRLRGSEMPGFSIMLLLWKQILSQHTLKIAIFKIDNTVFDTSNFVWTTIDH